MTVQENGNWPACGCDGVCAFGDCRRDLRFTTTADAHADRRLRRCADPACCYPHYWIDGDTATGVMYRCPSDDPARFGYAR